MSGFIVVIFLFMDSCFCRFMVGMGENIFFLEFVLELVFVFLVFWWFLDLNEGENRIGGGDNRRFIDFDFFRWGIVRVILFFLLVVIFSLFVIFIKVLKLFFFRE